MPSISSTPKALPLGKMIVFITIRVGAAICPRASHFSPSEGTHENPALATCVGGTSWVTLGEQTRVICRECRRFVASVNGVVVPGRAHPGIHSLLEIVKSCKRGDANFLWRLCCTQIDLGLLVF